MVIRQGQHLLWISWIPLFAFFFFFLNLSGPRGEQATRLASSPGLVVWGKRSH